jgi:hypothetical protein
MKGKQVLKYVGMFALVFYTLYMISNYDWFVTEHLSNPPPSLSSLDSGLQQTNAQVKKLQQEVDKMKSQSTDQVADAVSAKAQLASMN